MQTFVELEANVATIVAPANAARQLAVLINYGSNDVYLGSMVDAGSVVPRNGGSTTFATPGAIVAIQGGPGPVQVCVYDTDAAPSQGAAGFPSGGGGPGVVQLLDWHWSPQDVTQAEEIPFPFAVAAGDFFLPTPFTITAFENIATGAIMQLRRTSGTPMGAAFDLSPSNVGSAPYIDLFGAILTPAGVIFEATQPYLTYDPNGTGSDGVLAVTLRFLWIHRAWS